MNESDYMFPKELRATASGISRVLMIGSCQTSQVQSFLRQLHPDIAFDYIASNYVGDLPRADPAQRYDLAFLQFPLRSILTDYVVWFDRLNEAAVCEHILTTATETLTAMYEAAVRYASEGGNLVFVSNFIVPQRAAAASLHARGTKADLRHIVALINDHLADLVARDDSCLLLDADGLAGAIGKRYVLDDDISFYGHNALKIADWSALEPPGLALRPIPPLGDVYPSKEVEFARLLFEQMEHDFRIDRQIDQVKAVVFDLDNTLWRGQLAEHYRDDAEEWPKSDTWPIGIWEAIHHLRARGILVSICSKNDHALVERNWARAIAPAFLNLSDFICPKINWLPKPENVAAILSHLNVKAKSVVLVDDNPVERESVAAALPGIRTIGENPFLVRRALLWSAETQVRSVTFESRHREDMIRRQITRDTERLQLDRGAFLSRLDSRLTFLDDDAWAEQGVRILELVNKTNQFNTTGRRWDSKALARFASSGGRVFAFRVCDRYADYGLVGLVLARDAGIEQVVMSCRVMGMDLEIAALAHVVDVLRERRGEAAAIDALVRLTPDNTPCRTLFERAGFATIGEDGDDRHFRLGAGRQPADAPHVKLSPGVRAIAQADIGV